MEKNSIHEYNYKTAQKKVKAIKGFYTHLTVFIFINVAILIVNTQDAGLIQGLSDISNYSTMFFWGIGLVAHWASVFGSNLIFGKKWEEKKIKELMEKDKKQLWK